MDIFSEFIRTIDNKNSWDCYMDTNEDCVIVKKETSQIMLAAITHFKGKTTLIWNDWSTNLHGASKNIQLGMCSYNVENTPSGHNVTVNKQWQ